MSNDADRPHPLLTKARKELRRWDIEIASSGLQSWVQTTSTKKRVWLIIQNGGEVFFDEI